MVSKSEIKKLIIKWEVENLERLEKRLTIMDCGPKAKQKDVTKIKEAIRDRINKLTNNVPQGNEVSEVNRTSSSVDESSDK